MDKFQHKLRLIIATGSAVGFLGGWALLSHAGKPVSSTTASDPVLDTTGIQQVQNVTLPPIDFNALESANSSINVQSFAPPPVTFQSFGRPRLRTGSS